MNLLATESFPAPNPSRKEAALGLSGTQEGDSDEQSKNVGGVDLNPSILNLNVSGEQMTLDIAVDIEGIQNLPIAGFAPIIFDITPVVSFPALLGT